MSSHLAPGIPGIGFEPRDQDKEQTLSPKCHKDVYCTTFNFLYIVSPVWQFIYNLNVRSISQFAVTSVFHVTEADPGVWWKHETGTM